MWLGLGGTGLEGRSGCSYECRPSSMSATNVKNELGLLYASICVHGNDGAQGARQQRVEAHGKMAARAIHGVFEFSVHHMYVCTRWRCPSLRRDLIARKQNKATEIKHIG